MKKQMLKSLLIATASVGLVSGSALAFPLSGNLYVNDGPNGTTDGGEFILTIAGTNQKYTAFCLELDEGVSKNNGYYSFTASDTVYGGGNNTNSGDVLSNKTQWLMYNYINNYASLKTLSGVSTANNFADLVQKSIWQLENESYYGGSVSTFINKFGSEDYGQYVTAFNLKEGSTNKQSMLIADPVAAVPEPTTMLLFGTGIIGLTGLARRKKK